MDESAVQERIRLEVARRLDEVLNTPDIVAKYDRDGDGVLEPEERDVLRYVVEAEVVREIEDLPTTQDPSDDEWPEEEELPVIEVVDERYELLKQLGRGTQGRTWLARSRETGDYFALKELSFQRVASWKSLELFWRETTILRQLNHPAIPRFIEWFRADEDDATDDEPDEDNAPDEGEMPRFFLVQEFVRGDGLDVVIARGDRMSVLDVMRFARSMLDVLEYLHGLHPAVVHRDVKPSNIVRQTTGYSLVDFGAVQLVAPDDTGGSTVVGTTGYMPSEQLSGRACPQSDLYALGATLVHLLTHVHPSKLPQKRLKLQWRDKAPGLHPPLADFIDKLIEPIVEDRYQSATAARAALDTLDASVPLPTRSSGALASARPADADAVMSYSGESLVVDMSPATLAPTLLCTALGLGVGVMLALATSIWVYVIVCMIAGYLVSGIWTSGPDERLQVMPDGRFHFTHVERKVRRETSGTIHGLSLQGSEIVLVTDGGTRLAVGNHCTPQTRRWIFGTVDLFLRSKR